MTTADASAPLEVVGVFCGSAAGSDGAYADMAARLGRHLAEEGITLVFGGSDAGLMGAVADAHLSSGGHVIGIYPTGTFGSDVAHRSLSELRTVNSMHARKAAMYELCDGVIALPGGYGTLEELFEALTWTQIGLHYLPAVLLDVDGYWEFFLRFLDRAVSSGFVSPANRALLEAVADPAEATTALRRMATVPASTGRPGRWSG